MPVQTGERSWVAVAPIEGPVPPGELVELVIDEPAAGVLPLAAELDLLDELGLAFAPSLIDSSVDRDGRLVAVRPRAASTGAELLALAPLDAPAAVSLLAPLVETILVAHDAGWTHGGLSLGALGVDAAGRPMVGAWQGAAERRGRDPAKLEAAAADDWRAVGAIIEALATGPRMGGGSERLAGLVRRSLERPHDPGLGSQLLDALFEWSPGGPIPELDEAADGMQAEGFERGLGDVGRSLLASQDDARAGARGAGAPGLGRVLGWIGGSRRALLLAAAGSIAAASLALAALGAVPRHAEASSSSPPGAVASSEARASPRSTDPSASDDAPTAPGPTSEGTAGANQSASPSVDDPVAAAERLLAERDAALAAGEPTRLIAAYADGSPGLERDLALIGTPAASPAAAVRSPSIRLEDRYGGYAIVADGELRRATLVETDAGWRLRDVRPLA